jgi:hypothetical protein
MSEQFKQTVERLPGILVKNAGPMMQRIVSAMQVSIMADQQLPDASYCALLLKMTADDLASGFERAVKESMAALATADANPNFTATGFSLAIEPMEGDGSSEKADFLKASAAFDRLFAKGNALGVKGLRNYDRDVLLACLKDAFAKSRMSTEEAGKVLPYARRALNDELVRLYDKLEAL